MQLVLLIVGAVVTLVGAIGLLIAAFHEGVGWGLACLLLPIVKLVFVVVHWDEAKKPFLIELAGIGIILVAAALGH